MMAVFSKSGNVTVIKKGAIVYYRTPWNTVYDYVCGFNMNNVTTVPYDNNNVNFISEGLVPVATADENVPTTGYTTTLKADADDACPANFNGTYIGANHGGNFVNQVTAAAHGKATVDIGSEWKDTANKKWYLLRIVDANTLWFISENQATAPVWSFLTTVGGNSLVHSLSATNTGTITITANTTVQLYPAYKNTTKKIFIDGIKDITSSGDGVYSGNFLEVLHSYDISDIPSIISFVRAGIPWAAAPAFNDATISNVARMTITYRIAENGSVSIFTTFKTNQQINLTYVGFTQSAAIALPSGGSIFAYAPKISSHTVSGRTYDFTGIQDITTFADTHDVVTSMWADANNPPERFVQFVKDSGGVKTYGNAVGYNQKVGIGQPAIRKTLIDSAWLFINTKKMYPKGISSGSTAYPTSVIPGNKLFDMATFRYPINYAANPNLTNFGWYIIGNDVYVNIDAHTTITNQWFQLPTQFAGRQIEVVEKNSDFTVNSNFVGQDGINFSIANSYGTAVLRLYN